MKQYEKKLKSMAAPLLVWYDANRRVLPWREEVSPYRTWVSEIMLQQTRVAAVLPYFRRFMERYPTVEALAAGEEQELLKLWEGLGYYSRARNLQKTARIVAETYGGAFPADYKALTALPGIGDYTAGAILSMAFGVAVPAVDGNALRIISRVTGSRLDVLEAKNKKAFRAWTETALPMDRPGAFNQAMMDLGAGICLPGAAPRCGDCPLAHLCTARQEGTQALLPVRAPKKEKRIEEKTVFLLRREDGSVALRQREKTGLLAGLWEYPNTQRLLTEEQAAAQLAAWGLRPLRWEKSWRCRHIFTHVRWEMQGYAVTVAGEGELEWYPEERRQEMAVPSAFERANRILRELEGDQNGTALL